MARLTKLFNRLVEDTGIVVSEARANIGAIAQTVRQRSIAKKAERLRRSIVGIRKSVAEARRTGQRGRKLFFEQKQRDIRKAALKFLRKK